MRKNQLRVQNALLFSLALHLLAIIIMGMFMENTYETVDALPIDWVKASPVELKARDGIPKPSPPSQGGAMKDLEDLPMPAARNQSHDISEVKVAELEFERRSVELDRDAELEEIPPIDTSPLQFDTDVRTIDTMEPLLATPKTVLEQIKTRRNSVTVDRMESVEDDTGGLSHLYGKGGTGEGRGGGGGVGDSFGDVGTDAPAFPEIDTMAHKRAKDIFGIGKYVDETRKGKQSVVYLLDLSTSMLRGRCKKLSLAVKALKDSLDMLQSADKFNIITFDHSANVYYPKMRRANKRNIRNAYFYLDSLVVVYTQNPTKPRGTNISLGLKEALNLPVSTIVIISDGKADKGITDTRELITFVKARNYRDSRILTIGLGKGKQFKGVPLLRELAAQNDGEMRLIDIQGF